MSGLIHKCCILLAIIFSIYYTFYISPTKNSVYQFLPLYFILLVALFSKAKNARFFKWQIVLGLTFSTIGIYFMQFFNLASLFILFGYILIARAFQSANEVETPSFIEYSLVIYGALMLIWMGGILSKLGSFMLTVLIIIFLIVIFWMAWTSFRTNSNFAAAGAVLLVISHSLLAIHHFAFQLKYAHEIIMPSYYCALLFIAISIANYSAIRSKK